MADGSVTANNARIYNVVQALLTKRDVQGAFDVSRSLQEAGLTSLDLVNLMLAIEAEFDLEIPQRDMTPENFRSIEAIERLVETLTASV